MPDMHQPGNPLRDTVRAWLARLGLLVAAHATPAQIDNFVENFAPHLATRFQSNAFTDTSLEAVAAECKFLPAYGELVAHLRTWCSQNRPGSQSLGALNEPERPDPTPDELASVARAVAEARAYLASIEQATTAPKPKPRYLTEQQLDAARKAANIVFLKPPRRA